MIKVLSNSKMNKTIWMCWFQGLDDPEMPEINRRCLQEWVRLNPGWDVQQLTDETIAEHAPEYFDVIQAAPHPRLPATNSEILRLQLLSEYGGVWADASLWPSYPLDVALPKILNETGFFGYRYQPPSHSASGIIDVCSCFLIVDRAHHPLVDKWQAKFTGSFLTGPEAFPYFRMHGDLFDLYTSDAEIRQIIDGMVQLRKETFLSNGACPSWVYKRPSLDKILSGRLAYNVASQRRLPAPFAARGGRRRRRGRKG